MPKDTFDKLIRSLPSNLKVLDVGVAGHEGENTSLLLADYFGDVTGITVRDLPWDKYPVIRHDFYKYRFKTKYDLVVLDLNIDNNIGRDWTKAGMDRVSRLLTPRGYVINYVMMTDDYGDPQTPGQIRAHSRKWWGAFPLTDQIVESKLSTLGSWHLIEIGRELRRPEILWTLLQKK